jgi:hypothetical protein
MSDEAQTSTEQPAVPARPIGQSSNSERLALLGVIVMSVVLGIVGAVNGETTMACISGILALGTGLLGYLKGH